MAEKKFSIEKSFLVLVEGNDEKTLFELMAERMGIQDIQVHCFGGVDNLSNTLGDFQGRLSDLQGLGIERDAEDSSPSAFQSVCDAIASANRKRDLGLAIPASPCSAAGADPRVVVWIKPRGAEAGAIEDIVLRSITDREELECIDKFIQCAQDCPDQSLCHLPSKPKVYSYIAIQKDPKVNLAGAFKKKYFDLDHEAFDELRDFLNMVCGRQTG